MLKSYGVECAGGHVVMCRRPCGGGPCDFSVSPSPFGLDFGTLGLWTLDLGLTICLMYMNVERGNKIDKQQAGV